MILRTLEELLSDVRGRVQRLERRLNRIGAGGGGGGTTFTVGAGLDMSGTNVLSVEPQLAPDLVTLPPGTNLNNVLATGWYVQRLSAEATVALNYPINRAGHLQVQGGLQGTGADLWMQTYTEYAPVSPATWTRQWRRTNYNGTWTGWTQIDPSAAEPLPDAWSFSLAGSTTIDGAAATWTDIDVNASVTYTLTRPLWVMVEGTGYIGGAASTYGMIGVEASGALTLTGEQGPDGTAGKFGFTAYGETTANGGKTLSFHKPLLLPVGTTTLKMRKRRNVTTGTPTLGYPTMMVTPIAWQAVSVPVPTVKGVLTRRATTAGQAFATTDTLVTWNVAKADSGHFTFDGTNTFTCVIPGTYRISAQVVSTQVTAIGWMRGRVLVNGSTAVEANDDRATVGARAVLAQVTVTLNAGDTVAANFAANVAGGTLVPDPNTFIELVPVATVQNVVDAEVEDTGWVDFSGFLLPGFGSAFQGRRIGDAVELRGSVTNPAIAAGSSVEEIAAGLPSWAIPTTRNAWGTGYFAGYSLGVLVRPAGTMAVTNRTALAAGSIQFTVHFFAN